MPFLKRVTSLQDKSTCSFAVGTFFHQALNYANLIYTADLNWSKGCLSTAMTLKGPGDSALWDHKKINALEFYLNY